MKPKPGLFLDTSALFAGLWSAKGGGRMLLKLGEAEAVQLFVSSQVLMEIEAVIRRKSPQQLPTLAILLDRSQIRVAPPATTRMYESCRGLIAHPGDARILADAWQCGADFLVTLDKAHFLDVPGLAEEFPFRMGAPGDTLEWYWRRVLEGG